MRSAVFIQARLKSSRLPAKALLDLDGVTLLGRVIQRARVSQVPVFVLTSTAVSDDLIELEAKKHGVDGVYRGSQDNVRSRFFLAAADLKLDVIARVTADNPFTEPSFITKGIENVKQGVHYTRARRDLCPDGTNVEVFSVFELQASEWSDLQGQNSYDTEHVTPEIINRLIGTDKYLEYPPDTALGELDPDYHLGIDTFDDYLKIRRLYSRLTQSDLSGVHLMERACCILRSDPLNFSKGRRHEF